MNRIFCFCTMALRWKYRWLAGLLADDLATHAPGVSLVVLTDRPSAFRAHHNVVPIRHRQRGIFCYHDKRVVLEKALSLHQVAVFVDADTRIIADVPEILGCRGLFGRNQGLLEHLAESRTPDQIEVVTTVARKRGIAWEEARWIGESLFILGRDDGREREFFGEWGRIGDYLELQGFYRGEGNAMGLAAAKVGWTPRMSDAWQQLNGVREHLDVSRRPWVPRKSRIESALRRRLGLDRALHEYRVLRRRSLR